MSPDTQNHTLPLVMMGILVVLGVAAWGLLYYRKRQLQDEIEGRFKDFREKAVTLMDQLDALRHRHKTLPSTDPDFTAPMSGATLALYNTVEADLNSLWDHWLEVMELWDQAQKLVRSGSGLAVRQAEEARKLLNKVDIDDLLRRSASCKERLDRLNQGHEKAREALRAGREELAVRRKAIDEGTGALPRSSPQHELIVSTETAFAQAEGMIVADPIGAEEIIARSRRSLADLAHRPRQEPDRPTPRRPRPTYSPLDELAAAAERFRTVAARLRLTNLLAVFARFWMIVWGFALLIGLLGPLMPLIVFLLGFVFILAGLLGDLADGHLLVLVWHVASPPLRDHAARSPQYIHTTLDRRATALARILKECLTWVAEEWNHAVAGMAIYSDEAVPFLRDAPFMSRDSPHGDHDRGAVSRIGPREGRRD